MESDSDGDDELEAEFSSMKQPPLIKQLQGILSEYPDGGQIIKELIQNAEDAGATEVKIMYDGRRINGEVNKKKIYRKFFQGPALCLYNDAMFTESDWEGIKMIYSSVKEEDPMKVGRFGLGFKSVFHITDSPCVLSGKHLLLIDPLQKSSDKVNATMRLDRLEKYKKMDFDAFLNALEGTFGLERDVIKKGEYPGTIFWFPLREKPSSLSETTYTESKIMDLIDVFKQEADTILIFLRSLTRVSLNVRRDGKELVEVGKVELVDNIKEITQKRQQFQSTIKDIPSDYDGNPVHNSYTMKVRTTNCKEDGRQEGSISEISWMIVNYFMGQNASPEFRDLIKDKKLGYIPYVGVAMPLSSRHSFEGHVFCFLPLPKEGSRLTGLPVHTNGFFALSQNRHHLKCATDEQRGKLVNDKSVLWNEALIKEAVPRAYTILIQSLVEHSVHLGNSKDAVNAVYDAIQGVGTVTTAWKGIEQALFEQLTNQSFLFYRDEQIAGNSKWINTQEACFALFSHLSGELSHTKEAVIKSLLLLHQKYVDVPGRLFDILNQKYLLSDITPQRLCNLLHQNSVYRNMRDIDKVSVLEYLLSGNDYNLLNGLELLPLASGTWVSFDIYGDPVYKCTEEGMKMFPGLENTLLRKPSNMPKMLCQHFSEISAKGIYQVRQLDHNMAQNLLKQTINKHLGSGSRKIIKPSSSLSIQWLKKVWEILCSRNIVAQCKDVPLIPQLVSGNWSHPTELQLLCMSEKMLLKQHVDQQLSSDVCVCMEALSVTLLPSLPDWIPMKQIKEYVLIPSPDSVVKLLSVTGRSPSRSTTLSSFNRTTQKGSRDVLVQYLNGHILDRDAKETLRHLQIFQEKTTTGSAPKYVSITENGSFIRGQTLPVNYPRPLIESNQYSESLLRNLGATEIEHKSLILEILNAIQQQRYIQNDVVMFMDYIIKNFHMYETDRYIIQVAKVIPFLKTSSGIKTASELFSTDDQLLQDLFLGESRFPDKGLLSNRKYAYALQCLGLKNINSVNANDLLQVAQQLHSMSSSGRLNCDLQKKARAFVDYLNRYPSVLGEWQHMYGRTFADQIKDLECIIHIVDQHASFPTCLPWYKHPRVLCKPSEAKDVSMSQLVGTTMPVVSVSTAVSKAFHWNDYPLVTKVLDQLKIVRQHMKVDNQTDSLVIIKAIYRHMSENGIVLGQINTFAVKQRFCLEGLIWNGEKFSKPEDVVVNTTSGDVDLRPYFYTIPTEFNCFQHLFLTLDCHSSQTVDILVSVLSYIDNKYHQSRQNESEVKKDMILASKILNRLAERRDELDDTGDILIPVESDEYETIKMKHIGDCVYDKDPQDYIQEDDEEPVFIVHEKVSVQTAKTLGVKSLNRKALSDTEELGFEAWGQDEPLTARIHTLLTEGYMDGLSVPKELIQNADDAGATTVKFLYDERTNDDAKRRLLSKGMDECQGPALWVYNDATFSREDLINITKLNGATKAKDVKKIGKFGLGFCSVYNLTDVPSFISGSNIVLFDPHMTFLEDALPGKSPGLKINLNKTKNRSLLRRQSDQFKPFQGIFGCDLCSKGVQSFKGTLFRLPLRTVGQAQNSKISEKAYSRTEVQELISMFISAAGNMFLFTQNVASIEIFHLPQTAASADDKSIIFSMTRRCQQLVNHIPQPMTENVLSRMSANLWNQKFTEVQKRTINLHLHGRAKTLIPSLSNVKEQTESVWLISWASGTKESFNLARQDNRYAFPLSAVSIPCTKTDHLDPTSLEQVNTGFYTRGHIFCFLPLPLQTNLQMHVNGYFDITSDRRNLLSLTEDDKRTGSKGWNEALMNDALVNALTLLLLELSSNTSPMYVFHSLWPTNCAGLMEPFKKSFFRNIIDEGCKVFKGNEQWTSFQNIVFLDPEIRDEKIIGEIAFELLCNFSIRNKETVIDMPANVLTALEESNGDRRHMIIERTIGGEELLTLFLQNIHDSYWDSAAKQKSRDAMIIYALDSESESIKQLLKKEKCIPTEPNGVLCSPGQLVHPSTEIAKMFQPSDGRFPVRHFREAIYLEKLVNLGMNKHVLQVELLLDRCYSVDIIAKHQCCECAFERIAAVVEYINREQTQARFKLDNSDFDKLQNATMLPVLDRPKKWQFPWKSESSTSVKRYTSSCGKHRDRGRQSMVLSKPVDMFSESSIDYVGTVENILDEACWTRQSSFKSRIGQSNDNVFKLLGVKGFDNKCIPVTVIVEQITMVSDNYTDYDVQYSEVKRIYDNSFTLLKKIITKADNGTMPSEDLQCIESLANKPIILIGNVPVLPRKVAYDIKEEVPPYLHKLPETEELQRKPFYDTIGVKIQFSFKDVIKVLAEKKQEWNLEKCVELEMINRLLQNLANCMEYDKKTYKDYGDDYEAIVAADVDGILRPTYQLVIDDEEFETSGSMKLLHNSVSPQLAEQLGVKAKKRKCFSEIAIGIPFGQHEPLVTRLNGLLKAYPCDEGIMKELLQNADDANATEIYFIKDYRNHSSDRIFDEKCTELQGPSLCIFNNECFTKEDLQGIHNLGQGSKGNDPTKTGQYGVGFNAVYHLTDTPSFMTKGPNLENGGVLCVFDPLCTHIPDIKHHEPGIRCEVDKLKNNFPDVLLGFLESEDIFQSGKGTLFRFPLRTSPSDISKNITCTENIDTILNQMNDDMFEALLFVKNIESIKVSNITSGVLKEEYSVNVLLSEEDRSKRETFFEKVKAAVTRSKNNKMDLLREKPFDVFYEMSVEDSIGRCKQWFIVQRFGFDDPENIPEDVIEAFRKDNLGNIPIGGVGILLPNVNNKQDVATRFQDRETTEHEKFKAFTFLPLPVETGLPVHINGHFALDHEARRDLWKEGYRKQWNECLIRKVVVHAYVTGIEHIRTLVKADKLTKWHAINQALNLYHNVFPIYSKAVDSYWKHLVTELYSFVVQNEIQLFPVVLAETISSRPEDVGHLTPKQRFQLQWVAFGYSGNTRLGCYNTISYLETGSETIQIEYRRKLEKMLKQFGLKILETPCRVYKSMLDSGLQELATSSCNSVIAFIKTCEGTDEGCCDIGGLDKQISETKLSNVSNLGILITYMKKGSTFQDQITHLPILLTRNNVLRKFCDSEPVIYSDFGWLLPGSAERFIHEDILYCLPKQYLLEQNLCSVMDVACFEEHLSETLSSDVYGNESNVPWKSDTETLPNGKWIIGTWEFIMKSSEKWSDLTTTHVIDKILLMKNIGLLSKWSILPCVETGTSQKSHLLIPASQRHALLDTFSFFSQKELYDAVKKFQLASLDFSLLHESSCYTQMKSLESCHKQPYTVLKCFQHHNEKIASSSISNNEALLILKYFSNQLETMKESNDPSLAQMLRSVPLYITQQGKRINLHTGNEMLVLPSGMPVDGMQDFANSFQIFLLRQDSHLHGLFEYLSLSTVNICQLYVTRILPNYKYLPNEHWETHIVYIRDKLLSRNIQGGFDRDQAAIIEHLKRIAFISINGRQVLCSDLFCRKNKVFLAMCDSSSFPPDRFINEEWLDFLTLLGMHTVVTDELMIRFARELEIQGIHRVSEELANKSKILITHFLEQITMWQEGTIRSMGQIACVIPTKVASDLTSICAQNRTDEHFVCFHEAVPSQHKRVCWSTCTLFNFQKTEIIKRQYLQMLGVHENPSCEKVLKHCQNISTSLQKKLEEETIELQLVLTLMTNMYEYLKKNLSDINLAKSMLQYFPVVYLPEETKLVTVSEIVKDVTDELIVQPYLYKAPPYFGMYHDLFVSLGTSEKIECFHFLKVLKKLYGEFKDSKLPPNKLKVATLAIQNLCTLLSKDRTPRFEEEMLYLPNENNELVSSTMLTVSNNPAIKERLAYPEGIMYFTGFIELGIQDVVDPGPVVKKLPTEIRPMLLTDVVKEIPYLDDMIVNDSVKAMSIQTFLRSPYLLEAVCRIIKHQQSIKGIDFDTVNDVNHLQNMFQCVHISAVSGLKTYLQYNGQRVEGSEQQQRCVIEQRKGGVNGDEPEIHMYFEENSGSEQEENDMMELFFNSGGLVELIGICTGNIIDSFYLKLIVLILNSMDKPTTISRVLDRNKIDPLDLVHSSFMSAFPRPGVYVEPQFYPFLEQALTLFNTFEYSFVALEVEDPEMDDEEDDTADSQLNQVFRYAHIVCEIDNRNTTRSVVTTKYIVNAGDQHRIEVPAYRLYRFVKRTESTSNEIELYDAEPIGAVPIGENFCRIREILRESWSLPIKERDRIRRRLLTKWHPERNRDNAEHATRVFNYIQEVMLKLERDEALDEMITNETGRRAPDTAGSSIHGMCSRVDQRATAYAAAYYNNYTEYIRPSGHSNYIYSVPDKPDEREAKRWMRQAKLDYRTAECSIAVVTDVPGFNWICYICHQACEKALKAGHYSINANICMVRNHSLSTMVRGLNQELVQQIMQLESDAKLSKFNRMRYPDAQSPPDIPSDIYTREDAVNFLKIAKTVIDKADEYVS